MFTLVDDIIDYAKDGSSTGRFAIVLYGEWGSGKTYFCERVLAPRLKSEGLTMVRVSLFGVDDADGFYEKLLAAVSSLPSDVFSSISGLVASGINKLLEDTGLRLDVKAQTILTILGSWIRDNAFVVLDDVERSGFSNSTGEAGTSSDLLGIVNDMVENHGYHVMLVRNKRYDINPATGEKVISRQFEYRPTATEVYEAVAMSLGQDCPVDFDARQATIAGIAASGKLNARALARALPLLKSVLSSAAISSARIDVTGRSKAYRDVVQVVLLAASGTPPQKPARDKRDGLSNEYILGIGAYSKYQDLLPILEPISVGGIPSVEVVESALSAYLAKRYPTSPDDAAVMRVHDQLRFLQEMEDNEAEELVADFNSVLLGKKFSPNMIVRTWRMYADFANLGFEQELPKEAAIHCLRRVIEHDPSWSYKAIYQEYSAWLHATPDPMEPDDALDALEAYAQECINCQCAYEPIRLAHTAVDSKSGRQLSQRLRTECERSYPTIHGIPVEYVVECFLKGTAAVQLDLHDVFRDAMPNSLYRYQESGQRSSLRRWLSDLKVELDHADAGSRLGNLRLGWLRKDVDSLLERIDPDSKDATS